VRDTHAEQPCAVKNRAGHWICILDAKPGVVLHPFCALLARLPVK
jgi:hypothetical protein